MSSGDLTLQQAADELGVHYMTAYRYVKLGLLYAEKRRGSWVIDRNDLAAFQGAAISNEPASGTLEDALIDGDEARAWQVVASALDSADDPTDLHLHLLAPALASIGSRWAAGELSIASEHKASAVANRIIARLGSLMASPGRRRGTVVIGAAPGDVHWIPSAIFADLLRSFGVDVVDLGASPTIEAFIEAIRRDPSAVVAISMTGPGHEAAVQSVVAALRSEVPDLPIGVGGGAIRSEADAKSLDADLWHDDHRVAAGLIADAAAKRQSDARSVG